MEAIKDDMFYVNFCYTRVLPLYQRRLIEAIQMAEESDGTPVTAPEVLGEVKDKINGFMDIIDRKS